MEFSSDKLIMLRWNYHDKADVIPLYIERLNLPSDFPLNFLDTYQHDFPDEDFGSLRSDLNPFPIPPKI